MFMSTQYSSSAPSSRAVVSNQDGPHDRLLEIVDRHRTHPSKRPESDHAAAALRRLLLWLDGRESPLWLDLCCGTGDSSRRIARHHSDYAVVGIDKSEVRLNKERGAPDPDNLLLLRADLRDFLPLLVKVDLKPARQTLYYPNPYPKASQIQKRWHAMSVFRDLIRLGGRLESRSNWNIYLEEMALALSAYGVRSRLTDVPVHHKAEFTGVSNFETKYVRSGQQVWALEANLGEGTL